LWILVTARFSKIKNQKWYHNSIFPGRRIWRLPIDHSKIRIILDSIAMPWTILQSQIHQVLIDRQLLPNESKILIAVSGGQDSLCLGQLLLDLRSRWQWELVVGHCDHGWAQDVGIADRVAQVAQGWQLPYHCETTVDLPETEAAARAWRYQALIQMAQSTNSKYIVTAHTQTDRAETILYNLIRGAGADGLSALSWRRELTQAVCLVRPLLEVNRSVTGQFCRDRQLPVWEDAYNHSLKFARNRLRQEIIPQLITDFNPQVESHLARTGELLRADVEYLELVAEDLYRQAIGDGGRLDRIQLQSVHLALQRRVIKKFLTHALGKMPTFSQIEATVALIDAPNRSRTSTLSGSLAAEVSGKWISI
jgi:tRNA(Ile)-lysidine synthase